MGQYKYLLFSFIAALTIAGCTWYIGVQFGLGYVNLITTLTFFFAFFTYTLDHYYDGQNATKSLELHSRHKVDYSAYKMAIKGISLTTICALYFFFHLPRPFLFCGIALAVVSAIYFFLIFKTKLSQFWKQVFSAIILALVMGVWVLVYPQQMHQASLYLLIVAMAVYSNLSVISYLDVGYDEHVSPNLRISSKSKQKLMILLLLLTISIFFLGFFIGVGQFWLFVPMAYLILLLVHQNHKAPISDVKRIAIDLLMLLPLIKFFF